MVGWGEWDDVGVGEQGSSRDEQDAVGRGEVGVDERGEIAGCHQIGWN